jgi:hypothetical protein
MYNNNQSINTNQKIDQAVINSDFLEKNFLLIFFIAHTTGT